MICRHSPHRGFKVGTLRSQAPPMAAIYKTAVCSNIVNIYNLVIGVGIQLSKLKAVKQGLFQNVSDMQEAKMSSSTQQ